MVTQEEFLKKHPAISPDKIGLVKEKQKQTQIKYAQDMTELEGNLLSYFKKPMSIIDPDTGIEIARMVKPSIQQIEMLTMPPKSIPIDISKYEKEKQVEYARIGMEHTKKQFEILAEIVVQPEHNKEWWLEHGSPEFLVLVQFTINKYMNDLGNKMENF